MKEHKTTSKSLGSHSPTSPGDGASGLYLPVRQSSVWVIARLGVSMTIGVVVTTFIIRSLSVTEFGIYTVLYSLLGYVSVACSFGIPDVFRRFIPEALQKKEYSLLKRLILRGLILRILLSALTVGVILALHGPIGRLLKLDNFLDYYTIFAFGTVFCLESTLLTNALHSLFLHKYSVIAGTLYTIFRGACVFLLLKMGWGMKGVLWAEVASWGMSTGLQWLFYHLKFVRLHRTTEKKALPLRRYARYAAYSSLNEVGSSILGVSTDFFIITAFLGPGAVALYAFAERVIRMFVNCLPHVVLIDVIRPTFFTKYAESGKREHLADMFNLLLKIGAFSVFPLAVGMFVLGDKMIAIIFKPDYLPCQPILWVLLISLVINVFATPSGLVLLALERVEIGLYSKVFAIYNVVAEILVIQRFGVLGVVVVTCSAVLMKNLFSFYFMKKYSGVQIQWRSLFLLAGNACVMAAVIWPLRPFITGPVSLAMTAVFGAGVYLVCAWLNKAFNGQERIWLNKILPKPVFCF